ncbi:hypothetical protein HY501_03535, partial [Candidatus Woesearchaeota archaeon]|nr:hypothetical protein [Candidatus Woesearchaeota archaeon]
MAWLFSRRKDPVERNPIARETIPILREEIKYDGGNSLYRDPPVPPRRVELGAVFGWGLIEDELGACVRKGYRALFMPDYVTQRLLQEETSPVWKGYTSLSLMATGKTAEGNEVVVFAHTEHYLCNPKNIRRARNRGKIKNGVVELPQDTFEELVAMKDSQKVFVVDYRRL